MNYPATVADIEAGIQSLAVTYPAICSRIGFTRETHEHRKVSYLRIGTGTGVDKPRVLIISGVHGREWAPPVSVLTFVEKLLEAYTTTKPIVYKHFFDTRINVGFKKFTVPHPKVKRIVEDLEFYVMPLVNPDGRANTEPPKKVNDWRKNMRKTTPSTPVCPGVDLNRNFDIGWNIDKYYSDATVASGDLNVSKNICNETYLGDITAASPAQEPETQNVQDLIKDKRINFFMDVHSDAGKLLFPWALAENQEVDPGMSFKNTNLDRPTGPGRDPRGTSPTYREWMPKDIQRWHELTGEAMRDAILDSTGFAKIETGFNPFVPIADILEAINAHERSTYPAEQAIKLYKRFYPGGSRDYAFSQQIGATTGPDIQATALDPILSFTFESGRKEDGSFHPHATKEYPKVEREVGAGLAEFLSFPTSWWLATP